jgi:hypothetical protein
LASLLIMLNAISLVHQVHLWQFHLVSLSFQVSFVKFRIWSWEGVGYPYWSEFPLLTPSAPEHQEATMSSSREQAYSHQSLMSTQSPFPLLSTV